MAISGAELVRYTNLHERRSTPLLARGAVATLALGGAFAAWVAWRGTVGFAAASHAWLAGACMAFMIAFLRVPFHLYWRTDAALLAQLPIEGEALLTAAIYRCLRGAVQTTLVVAIGALPLAHASMDLALRHAALAGVLGITAALLIPAVALFAAHLVALSTAGTTPSGAPTPPNTPLLGALPGFAGTGVFVAILLLTGWLTGDAPSASPPIVLAVLAAVSVLAFVATRTFSPRVMGTILRDVSALDRQRLATLEIRPPTGLEKLIGSLTGDGALAYSKDARLMRRRYPMAYALGALAFLVLVIIGFKQPADPLPWLVAILVGATAYGIAVAGRLYRAPIELPRLSAALPIAASARHRAKLAWVIGWWFVYIVAPALFAALRQPSPLEGLALVGGGTLVVIGSSLIRR